MGDPRRQKRKYAKPMHMWRMDRIDRENALIEKYGLKNKREIWQAQATINRVRTQAIRLQALSGVETDKEKNDLIERLGKAGLIKTNTLESILALTVEDLLERRLQTIVYRRGIAQTPRQARQLITHGHIIVGDNVVTVPRYPVKVAEENTIHLVGGVRLPETKAKKTPEKTPEDTPKEKEPTEVIDVEQGA